MCGKLRFGVNKLSLIKAKDRMPYSNDTALLPGAQRNRMTEAVSLLERRIEDPTKGLPEEVFRLVSGLVPMVNVDLLIRNDRGEILLTWRQDGIFRPGWHIPGGIVRFKESMADRVHAVARKELGVRLSFNPMPMAMAEVVATRRRVRGHFISFLYACSLRSFLPEERRFKEGRPQSGEWAWHAGCPRDVLAIQRQIYGDFLKRRSKHT